MYLALIKNAKHVTWLNYEHVTFMMNCFVEVMKLNKDAAYVVGFTYLREIAVHLKNCMKERTKENVHKIYNWQFLNCIRLWFQVIGAFSEQDDLGKLIHPLIEITIGILKFFPNPKYAPLRLHIIDYLMDFTYKSGIYIPVVGYIFELMKEANVNKKRDKSASKSYDFVINVKTQKMFLKSQLFYEELFKLCLEKLTVAFSNLTLYVSYPESIVTSILLLRKHIKNTKNKELRDQAKELLRVLESNAKKFAEKRKEINFSENNADLQVEIKKVMPSNIFCIENYYFRDA